MRRSPAPYSLPIIPRSLPSEIVEGEHFVTSDLLDLLAGSVPPTGDPEAEALNREQALRASSVPSTSTSGDFGSTSPVLGRDARSICPARLPLQRKRIGSTPRVLKTRKKGINQGKSTRGAQVEDFIPWARSEPNRPSTSEEEEEEEEMTGLLDRYAARKRKRQEDAEREVDQAEGSDRPPTVGGLEMQTIVIPGSPEVGSNDQSGSEDIARGGLREDALIPPALQVVHPLDQFGRRSGTAKLVLSWRKRSLPPDWILLNSYLPPHDSAPVMEEVTAPGLDDIKLILHHWKPFNRGESAEDRLDDLYLRTLPMPVTAREVGHGEEYFVAVPVRTIKEDI